MKKPWLTRADREKSIEERFWARVGRRNDDECWPWLLTPGRMGYGRFKPTPKDQLSAHRTAWELTHGPIPSGLWVLHRCDNRRCCNPAHLFLGTPRDNTRDMMAKGRNVPPPVRSGATANGAKLSEAEVLATLERLARGERGAAIANALAVSQSAVSAIKHGKTWRAVRRAMDRAAARKAGT